MPDKSMRMTRAAAGQGARRPVLLAIAGDSAAGKTTLTRGLAQHLQLLATGQPILKHVYDHRTGELGRPELVEPNDFVIVEGLLPLCTKLARACFEVAVFLNPPEPIRHGWKVARDTAGRGYTQAQVLAELDRREPESERFIRPQQQFADIVVGFAPIEVRDDPPGTPLSAELMPRPTIRHPDLYAVLVPTLHRAIHLKLERDPDGRPCDTLHVHGYVPTEESQTVQKAIWASLAQPGEPPDCLGRLAAQRTDGDHPAVAAVPPTQRRGLSGPARRRRRLARG